MFHFQYAVLVLLESIFLTVGAVGSMMVAWAARLQPWLDVFSFCLHWFRLFAASGCHILHTQRKKKMK